MELIIIDEMIIRMYLIDGLRSSSAGLLPKGRKKGQQALQPRASPRVWRAGDARPERAKALLPVKAFALSGR